ncbi:AraC family transcriptional regulator [Thalassotalea sp. HSM 43]|uniref:helix-turn-helix domain-containing protein n=1 Tax=Thalassotalea sp. HSM 43 TaxID=2552945 RepID=UPI00108093AC|nr:AraC family transcriptional regulator [Thalassotalea sp. HSM 43]QBY03316.1 AraC family transcriptional regulator [Thalassotalea sp. HSM 43]
MNFQDKTANLDISRFTKRYLFLLDAFRQINCSIVEKEDKEVTRLLDTYSQAPDLATSGRKYIKNIIQHWAASKREYPIHLSFTNPINPALFGIFGLTVGSATTLRCFFEFWAEFSRILFIFNSASFEETDEYGILTFIPDQDVIEDNIFTQTIQGFMSASISNLRTVSSASFCPDKLSLPVGSSENIRSEFSQIAGCEVVVSEQKVGKLFIKKERLQTLLPAGDSYSNLTYYQLAAKRISELFPDNMALKVRSWIVDSILQNNVDTADISKDLGLSLEYINQKLAEQDTDIQKLKNEVTPVIARHLLQQPGVQIKEIAFKLGYTSSSSFNKAYNRWMNESPAEYRKSYTDRINNLKF